MKIVGHWPKKRARRRGPPCSSVNLVERLLAGFLLVALRVRFGVLGFFTGLRVAFSFALGLLAALGRLGLALTLGVAGFRLGIGLGWLSLLLFLTASAANAAEAKNIEVTNTLKNLFTSDSPLKYLWLLFEQSVGVSPSTRPNFNAFVLVTWTCASSFPFTLDEFIYESASIAQA